MHKIIIIFQIFLVPLIFAQEVKLIAEDGESGDNKFGRSVSISGDYIAIGAPEHDLVNNLPGDEGAVYIFHRSENTWNFEYKILANDIYQGSGDFFGGSVSISGDYLIVGAEQDTIDNKANQGSAYIFHREGTNWNQQAKLVASDGEESDLFGGSVSISGDYAIVGADWKSIGENLNQGAAYIFHHEGTNWNQQAKLVASDGEESDLFGGSVSISGDYAIVGAQWEDEMASGAGAAYIFNRSGTSWIEQLKLTADDAASNDLFGCSVSISGDYTVVGAQYDDDYGSNSGSAYIFRRSGSTWEQVAKLLPEYWTPYDQFGCSVCIYDDIVVVGAYGADNGGYDGEGRVYTFKREGSNWYQSDKQMASDRESGDWFGWSVAVGEDYAIVGALFDEIDENESIGSAYVYNILNDLSGGVRVSAKVFLEGPYDVVGDTMSTELNPDEIPEDSPFSEDPRIVSEIPSTATDWILVQLRSTPSGANLSSKSCFLNSDGSLLSSNGLFDYVTVDVESGDYYVVIKHRNHLTVMNSEPAIVGLAPDITPPVYNFTSSSEQFYGGALGAIELESNVWGMVSGDANRDGGVYAEDYTEYQIYQGDEGYYPADYNMDKGVYAEDYSIYQLNQGKESAVPNN